MALAPRQEFDLRLKTFGTLGIVRDGVLIRDLEVGRRPLSLLAVMATEGSSGVTRDRLQSLFWPDREPEKAQHLLTQAIYTIRRALGADAIIDSAAASQLNAAVLPSDVGEFQAALVRGDLASAVELCSGPFLDGFHLSDAPGFERWVEETRSTLSRDLVRALTHLADAAGDGGDYAGAVTYLRRAVATDPLSGALVRMLMVALAQAGDPSAALNAGKVHTLLVRAELESDPDPAVRDLIEAVRTGGFKPPERRISRFPTEDPGKASSPTRVQVSTQHVAATPPAVVPIAQPTRRSRVGTVVGASASIVLVIAGVFLAIAPRSRLALARTLLTREAARLDAHRVVVAPFYNETGDTTLENLGDMAADWITHGLSRSGVADVVDGPTVLLTSRIVAATPRFLRTGDRARALAEETGAGTLIWGTYYRDGDSLSFETRISDLTSGDVVRAIEPVSGPSLAPARIIDRLGRRVVGALAVVVDTANASWTARDEPPSYEAYRELVLGVTSYFRLDTTGAFRHLQSAAALDPTYVAPLIAQAHLRDLYHQWGALDTLLRRIEVIRGRSVGVEEAWLDHLHAELRGDQAASLEGARELARLSPGSAEYAALVAATAVHQNRPREALEALSRADPHRGLMLVAPWYWIHRANAYHELASYEQELRDARAGVRQFPEDLYVKYCELRALIAIGQVDEAELALRRATERAADRSGVADRLRLALAREMLAHGHRIEATRVADRLSGDLRASLADSAGGAGPLERARSAWMLAQSLYLAEHWEESNTLVASLAAADTGNVEYQISLATIAARRGDRHEAERIATKLATLRRPYLFGLGSYGRARVAAVLGARDQAVALFRDALAQGLRGISLFGDVDVHTEQDFAPLRDYPPFAALLQPKE